MPWKSAAARKVCYSMPQLLKEEPQYLKTEINKFSAVHAMEMSNALLCKNCKCMGDGEKKIVQLEIGMRASGSGKV